MSLDAAGRSVLAALADVLIPAGGGFPPASEAGVAGEGLDAVLASRPDLLAGLERAVGRARGRDARAALAEIRVSDPDAYAVLAELVPGAYFMNQAVRAALGYSGQVPRPIDPRPDHLDGGLLQSVIDRGPIYRPTPRT